MNWHFRSTFRRTRREWSQFPMGPRIASGVLRNDYVPDTNALFSRKIEGLGWESDRVAFRIYFDPRNAIDIYGKRQSTLQTGHVCIARLRLSRGISP